MVLGYLDASCTESIHSEVWGRWWKIIASKISPRNAEHEKTVSGTCNG